jgi:catechol-2,3-dioxygenase
MHAPLIHAQSGERWLLVAYDFGGIMIDYFVLVGEPRPPSRGREEVRHCGVAVGTPEDLAAWKARIAASRVEMWTEQHGASEHVYFLDPSGNVFELTADEWTVRGKGIDPREAERVLAEWRGRLVELELLSKSI